MAKRKPRKWVARFYLKPEDKEPARTMEVEAQSLEEAAEKAARQMREHEKWVDMDLRLAE